MEKLLGGCSFDLIDPKDKQSVINGFKEIIEAKKTAKMEAHLLTASGYSILFEGVGTPVLGKNGAPEHFIVVGRDISEKV